ncbi:MAG: hypothetical protein ACK55Z_07660 [bacterium]
MPPSIPLLQGISHREALSTCRQLRPSRPSLTAPGPGDSLSACLPRP